MTALKGGLDNYNYQYNGLGDRIQQTVNGVTTTYTLDLAAHLTEVLSDGASTYINGLGRIGEERTSDWLYHMPDALGSVRQLVDDTGAVSLAQTYQPYGEVWSRFGDGISNYSYTGEQLDTSGLIYLRARYMDSSAGRFITRDTWMGDYNQPMSLNRWMYTLGNPVNYTDPSGKWYCVGGDNCEEWISDAFENLSQLEPDGKELVDSFEKYDLSIKSLFTKHFSDDCYRDIDLKTGTQFIITNSVPGGYGMAVRPARVYIDSSYLSREPNGRILSLFAHELHHQTQQSFLLAISIQGELEARKLQARLNELQGRFNNSDAFAYSLDLNKVEDLDTWREVGGYKFWQPYAPPYKSLIGPNGEQCHQKINPYTAIGLVCIGNTPSLYRHLQVKLKY